MYAMLKKLTIHDFTAKMQARFVQETKEQQLTEGEYLGIADFSKHYSFVVQHGIQSFHWNNGSATVHPFVCYYKEKGELCHLHVCFIIISESTQHDVIAVHIFQKKLIEFLKNEAKRPQKIIYMYFSDGCAAQYNNCYTCACMSWILACLQSGTFLPPLMANRWRWCWGDSEVICNKS